MFLSCAGPACASPALLYSAKPIPKLQSLTTVKNSSHRVRFLNYFKQETDILSVSCTFLPRFSTFLLHSVSSTNIISTIVVTSAIPTVPSPFTSAAARLSPVPSPPRI